jgi:peroxisomal 2,4-dienoyl-CoA reductase
MGKLDGKVAIVTGAAHGIGRATARRFGQEGATVVIADIDRELGVETTATLAGEGLAAEFVETDVAVEESIRHAVDSTAERHGRLDILVNGAAGNFLCRAEDLSPNAFGAVVDIDLKGTFHMCRAALPHLKRQGGVVLNISATLHYFGTAAQLHVSAAKAGVDALTRVLAVEWGEYGIRVNGIAPGPIADTEGVRRLLVGPAKDRVVEMTPLRRLGAIDDVSKAALYLCSDLASFVSGVTLVVDGGLWLTSSRMAEAWDLAVEAAKGRS